MPNIDMSATPNTKAACTAAQQIYGRVVTHLPEIVLAEYDQAYNAPGVAAPIGLMEATYAGVKLANEDLTDAARADLAKVAGDLANNISTYRYGGAETADRAFDILNAMRRHLGEAITGEDPEVDAKFLPPAPLSPPPAA